jgi:hypothetical protein
MNFDHTFHLCRERLYHTLNLQYTWGRCLDAVDEPRAFWVMGFSRLHNVNFAVVLLLNVSIMGVVNPDAGCGLRSVMFGGLGLFGKERSSR